MKRFMIKYNYILYYIINHSCTNLLTLVINVELNQKSFLFGNIILP